VSADATVEHYLADAPERRREVLGALRRACLAELDGFAETMAYRMPSYERDGEVEVAFANQKQYISLYILRTDVMATHRARLEGLSVGKGCIRYRKPADVDLDLVRSMLRATAASTGPVC
jgi:uncharacterized protein YdhG (YjbR/CyaY superfamily)